MLKLVTMLLGMLCTILLTSCNNQEETNHSHMEKPPSNVVDTSNDDTDPSTAFNIENIASEACSIKEYIQYAKSVSASYKLYELRMDFFDADDDDLIDMVLYLSNDKLGSLSYLFKTDFSSGKAINQTEFFQSAFSGFSYGKFENKKSDCFYLMACDKGENIMYIPVADTESGGEDLFFRGTFDDRVTKTLTPIYIVHPFAAECSGYYPTYIEIDGIDIDYLVTEDDYNMAKDEFSKSVFAVVTSIKSISLTYEQLANSSVDEIFNTLENNILNIDIF